ncbi:MAG: CRTAC1 family protein [Rhodothermales bacterium]|nr:CRTAC1 family protein [Rhodothermales bacterium]
MFLFAADLDSDLDLFAANGHVQPMIESVTDNIDFKQPPHLFENLGDGTFDDIVPKIGGDLAVPVAGRGASFGDVDNDGDIDILVAENNGPAYLFINESDRSGSFLRVNLRGKQSNYDGIDAEVTVTAGDARITRRVRTGGSFMSNSEKTVTFGVPVARIDSLVVRWPSGQIDRYAGIDSDQTVTLTEGDTSAIDNATRSR